MPITAFNPLSFLQPNHGMANPIFFFFIIILLSIYFPTSTSQSIVDSCNGIFISYNYTGGYPIPPMLLLSNPTEQPYRFESTLTILNNGLYELKSWRVFIGFDHSEILVSASNALFSDDGTGSSFPADVRNGFVLSGFPVSDLKTAVDTAGDFNQMGVRVELVGTQFGVAAPDFPLPSTITLANDGYFCPAAPTKQENTTLNLCCTRDLSANSSIPLDDDDFLPLQNGDLTIMYDVISSFDSNYWAQVTISNQSPIGRLDNWQLSWDWMRDEFISTMKGAYPSVVDTRECIFGRQGEHYKDKDFSTVLNCERRPTIIDLLPTMANDANLGMIPFCCRNGTILPPSMDSNKSKSVFQMQVHKMPPDLNRTQLFPPQNWKINGTLVNPDYRCGSPMKVSPSRFPNPSGLPSESSALASWQVVCNIRQSNDVSPSLIRTPTCCVSFSAFFNDTVVPCNTCACGCNKNPDSNTCSATTPALLLPSKALLVPFENRTKYVKAQAKLKKLVLPKPLPCGDNCGVSINWHLVSDYDRGWSARISLFNWGETDFVDWFAAVELDKAGPGFEAVYSFNGSALPGANTTIFMQGLPDFNYLVAAKDGKNPKKDFRMPGTQQSMISFNKKNTPGINVAGRDGFPTKVIFNGEECSIPTILPSHGYRMGTTATGVFSVLVGIAALLFMQH